MKTGKVKRGDWATLTGYDREPILVKVGNPYSVPNPHKVHLVPTGLRSVWIPGQGKDFVREEDLTPVPRKGDSA
jgi:hypothetical protein